ncbi:MAG TPA: LamG-like jellyroll fold domain-containing protein, partial [Clostridia bacterium]|nr:LamG-like jellyroll fold domain-containing protein [Clostridia bacterium]
TLSDVQNANAGAYWAVITNEAGAATSAVATLTVYSTTIGQGLVTHLKFDNNFTDSSGRGNDAASANTNEFLPGQIGQAVHINSSRTNDPNDYVTLNYPPDLKFGSAATSDAVDFSFSFWTKVLSRSGDKPFIASKDWDSGGNRGWVIASQDGGLKWNYRDDQSARRDSTTVGPELNDGGWHHVVVTFERTNYGRIYLDGVLIDAANIAPDAGKPIGTADTDDLGNRINLGQDGVGDYTDGSSSGIDMLMDDVGVWRRVITPQEVEAIYNAGLSGKDVTQATLYGAVAAPVITFQPVSLLISEGSPANFSVTAQGGNPLAYQWRLNNANLAGATHRTFTLAAAYSTNAGDYTVVVSNAGGSVTSSVATLTIVSTPLITTQPQNQTNNQHMDVTFSVTASGGALAYQWKHEGTNVPNATNATLVLESILPAHAGAYAVEVSNSGGSTTSSNALLVVLPIGPIQVTGQWNFTNGTLEARTGLPLEFFDSTVEADTTFGTTTSFGIADIGGVATPVLHFGPSVATWGGYKMHHNAPANGGGAYVNQYTLIYDIYYPAASDRKWRALLQTSTTDGNDGDFFVGNGNGIGISGNYQGQVTADEWHRIALAVDLTGPTGPAVAKFIDGVKVGYQVLGDGKDGRWSLDPFALLFADEDGETSEAYVSSVQFRNGKMSDAAIAALGGATASKIPASSSISVSIRIFGTNIEIHHTGSTGLEQADSPTGPWSTVIGAANPYVIPMSSGGTKFFRSKL